MIVEKIQQKLVDIEKEHQVKILYACESGSRAWGFESKDSDYDVRFIYIKDINWYLNLEHQRDVIECPIENELDVNGWDLKKSLILMKKSKPPLFEWLESPIIYLSDLEFYYEMRKLSKKFYISKGAVYHYNHTASANFREYLQGVQVRVKKYFYVLRPLLSAKWIKQGGEVPPPMEFNKLVEHMIPNGELKDDIKELVERKRNGLEDNYTTKIWSISQFIEKEMDIIKERIEMPDETNSDIQLLNDFFQKTLRRWYK